MSSESSHLARLQSIFPACLAFILISMCFLIGAWMKIVLFRFIFTRGLAKTIDRLIVAEHAVNSINGLVCLHQLVFLGLGDDKKLAEWTGDLYCWVFHVISVFGFTYQVTGGSGIAIYRILYLYAASAVKCRWGEVFLYRLVLGVGLSLACVVSVIISVAEAERGLFFQSLCNRDPGNPQLKVSTLNFSLEQISLGVCLLALLLEIACYVAFFVYVCRYERWKETSFLARAGPRKRARHAVSMLGGFVSWSAEAAFVFALAFPPLLLGEYTQECFALALLYMKPSFDFAVLPLVQVLSSSEMRRRIFSPCP